MAIGIIEGAFSACLIPAIGVYGAITLYTKNKIDKKMNLNLQHLNPYEQQRYYISNSSDIANKYNTIPIYTHIDYTGKELVRPYMEQLVKHFGSDIRLASKNFSTLKLEKTKDVGMTGATGTYNGCKNIIKYVKDYPTLLGHEMLHMASYMYNEQTKVHHNGFMQTRGEAIIGRGLNEGYTELLTGRLFNNGVTTTYPRLVRIVKLLEEFFPNPQMMSHYYFTCDLPAFIHHLSKYCSVKEAKEIVMGLDELFHYEYTLDSPVAAIKEVQLSTKIYTIYERNFSTQPAKVKEFKTKAGENKLTALAISGRNFKLQRQNTFTTIKTGVKNCFTKVKNIFKGKTPQPAYTR